MECKVCGKENPLFKRWGFNRNIVECKDHRTGSGTTADGVLIETLWNVKNDSAHEFESWVIVLIETLWNVKKLDHRSSDPH